MSVATNLSFIPTFQPAVTLLRRVFYEVKNMSRSIDRKFYESPEWRRCKAIYLERANHLCERCLAKGRYEPAKIVHHKVYLTEENYGDRELMFGFDNLEALCQSCHNDEHGHGKNERRWQFIDGELITRDPPCQN